MNSTSIYYTVTPVSQIMKDGQQSSCCLKSEAAMSASTSSQLVGTMNPYITLYCVLTIHYNSLIAYRTLNSTTKMNAILLKE